jgi:hypothetical protein
MKKILLLVSLAFVSLLVCANPEDDRGVPMRAQGACPPVHANLKLTVMIKKVFVLLELTAVPIVVPVQFKEQENRILW